MSQACCPGKSDVCSRSTKRAHADCALATAPLRGPCLLCPRSLGSAARERAVGRWFARISAGCVRAQKRACVAATIPHAQACSWKSSLRESHGDCLRLARASTAARGACSPRPVVPTRAGGLASHHASLATAANGTTQGLRSARPRNVLPQPSSGLQSDSCFIHIATWYRCGGNRNCLAIRGQSSGLWSRTPKLWQYFVITANNPAQETQHEVTHSLRCYDSARGPCHSPLTLQQRRASPCPAEKRGSVIQFDRVR